MLAGVICLWLPERCTPASGVVPAAQEAAPWVAVIEPIWDDLVFEAEHLRRALASPAVGSCQVGRGTTGLFSRRASGVRRRNEGGGRKSEGGGLTSAEGGRLRNI